MANCKFNDSGCCFFSYRFIWSSYWKSSSFSNINAIVASMGANAGTQTLTVVVREFAVKELTQVIQR